MNAKKTAAHRGTALRKLALELQRRGWDLHLPTGHEELDMFADVWRRVATRGGFTLVVDRDERGARMLAGKEPTEQRIADGPCLSCNGTGAEFHDVPALTMRSIVGNVVERTPARKKGDACMSCEGTGRRVEERTIKTGERFPMFGPNPKHHFWHVEDASGTVRACGNGVLASWDDDAKRLSLVERIERATRPQADRPARVEAITISEGLRPGFLELRFPAKPDVEVLEELKAAGWRWARGGQCWYGLETALPERYRVQNATRKDADSASTEELQAAAAVLERSAGR